MKKHIAILFGVILLAFSGCATISGWFGGGGAKFDNFADPTKPFMGYMTVNNWSSKDPSDVMEKLVKKNIKCMPFEFFESPLAYADPNVAGRIAKFQKYVDESQKRKIILYVTLLNCNLGSSKTGHPEITAPGCDKQIMAAANALAGWMKKYSNIYVTPCGEGGLNAKTYERNLQNWCKASMPLDHLVNNWGSRPTGTDGMRFYCQHPAGITAKVPANCWNMSDHSTTINQLNGGSGMLGVCNYAVTFNYAKSMWVKGIPFIYYHYDPNGGIDDNALNALNDAQK